MSFPILLWGGPMDGKAYVLPEDEMTIKFITMVGPANSFDTQDEDSVPTAIPTNYVIYLRTKKMAHGSRLYRYVPNG